jgi:predicted dehydrogenase
LPSSRSPPPTPRRRARADESRVARERGDADVVADTAMTAQLRAGVVGVGHLGRFHAEKYAALDGVTLVGIADLDAARAAEVAAALGTRVFAEHRALAAAVDCASVAVPTRDHAAVTTDLLAAGVDVLVEKPLASTAAEGAAMVRAAESAGRILQVGHLERFNPALRAAAAVITEPRFLECHRLAPFVERGTDVDVIRDLMIHDLDVIQSFVGAEVASVESVGVPVLTAMVDIANARLRFANGCIANVTASRVSVKKERKLRIFQPEAYVAIDYDQRMVRIFRRLPPAVPGGLPEITVVEHDAGQGDPLRDEIAAFIAAVRTRSAPLVGGREGLRALELAERIVASLEPVS